MNNLFKFKIKAFALMTILFVSISGALSAQIVKDTIAIIDAGSSGSKLYVYEIAPGTVPVKVNCLSEVKSEKDTLSKVENEASKVQAFLDSVTSKSKIRVKDPIKLYVLATAGMRKKNEADADNIYKAMEQGEIINGYKVEKAMTISGRYEGLYAWIAANHKNGEPQKGILEIGGASMQITFALSKSYASDIIQHSKYGNIYSKSYLDYGVDAIYEKHKDQTPPYNFDEKLDEGSKSLLSDVPEFFGLGRSVGIVLDSIGTGSLKDYIIRMNQSNHPYNPDQNNDKYHARMNAHYIKWIVDKFEIESKLKKPREESSWTLGAALDILVDKRQPEKYDYTTKN